MSLRSLITCVLLISASNMASTHAQSRMSDADLEKLLRSLRDHSRSFRLSFDSALKRTSISRTSRAKNAEQAAESFQRGTESLLNDFMRTRRGEDKLRSLQRSAQQMHTFVNTYRLGRQVGRRWGRVETELQQVRVAYAARASTAKENARTKSTHATRGGSASCLEEIGEERAARIVDQCLEISPATHPPCNSQNPCALIINEIKRSCALSGTRGAPAFCKEYR
jgi:flagellar hook-basal body complex protein FliE